MKKPLIMIVVIVAILILLTVIVGYVCLIKNNAEHKFKEVFGTEVPNDAIINKYYYRMKTGYCAFDIVFDEENFSTIINFFQGYIDKKFEDKASRENCKCYDMERFHNLPVNVNWYDLKQMNLLQGYMVLMPGHRGENGGTLRIAIVRLNNGEYHALIDY